MREARVHHDGVYFLFALEPDGAAFDVLEGAREHLPDVRRPPAEKERELVEGYLAGETWLRSKDTIELSREEAHILARRHADHAAAAIGLDDVKREKLFRILDEETLAAFDRVHARGAGLGPDSFREFEIGSRRTIERCKAFLEAREVERLEEYLTGLLGD